MNQNLRIDSPYEDDIPAKYRHNPIYDGPRTNPHDRYSPPDAFDPTAPHLEEDEGMSDYVYSPLNPEPPGAIEEGHRQRLNAEMKDENMYHGLVLLAFFMFLLGVSFVAHWAGLF